MDPFRCLNGMKMLVLFLLSFSLGFQIAPVRAKQVQTVTVSIKENSNGPDLSDSYLGLSFESSSLLPTNGQYYFDPNNQAMVRTFQTLGIKSLRVGANGVDDPHVPIPQEKDIDVLFNFARATGVKVIYSFRLRNGNPADSARLASYIAAHYADALDCFSIGNEPDFYLPGFDAYLAVWKPHYDAILHAVPQAKFDGPSVGGDGQWAIFLAKSLGGQGHLAMAGDHHYFLGDGRVAEKDPTSIRDRFLSNSLQGDYQGFYDRFGRAVINQGVPYRIDEMNSCAGGGAKDCSDTYTSTLWALDCTHWWATRHILGVNYHTNEAMQPDGSSTGNHYAAFTHLPGGHALAMRPQAYAYLAFTQGAHGQPLPLDVFGDWTFNFNAYAYLDHDGSYYLTLINKSYGDRGQTASVLVILPHGTGTGHLERLDLVQKDSHITAKTDITLGGAPIDTQGEWSGQWKNIGTSTSNSLRIQVPPTSATIIRLRPGT